MENIFLWKNGIPQYDLDHDVLIKNISDFHKKNKKFYILGNYIKGISVSDCIQNAFELSKKL
jgi:oxygen-dependent protoporphyrinogen oxidase